MADCPKPWWARPLFRNPKRGVAHLVKCAGTNHDRVETVCGRGSQSVAGELDPCGWWHAVGFESTYKRCGLCNSKESAIIDPSQMVAGAVGGSGLETGYNVRKILTEAERRGKPANTCAIRDDAGRRSP